MRVEPSGPTPSIRVVIRRLLQFRFARCGTSGGSAAARRPPRPAGCPSAARGRRRRPRWRPCPPGRPSPSGLSIGSLFAGPGVTAPANWTRAAPATLVITTTRQRRERNAHRPARRLHTASRSGWLAAAASGPARPWQSRARTTAMFAVPDETVGDESTSRASGEQPAQQAAGRLGQLQGGQARRPGWRSHGPTQWAVRPEPTRRHPTPTDVGRRTRSRVRSCLSHLHPDSRCQDSSRTVAPGSSLSAHTFV
jgi:hypothetical protein